MLAATARIAPICRYSETDQLSTDTATMTDEMIPTGVQLGRLI